MGLPYVTLIDVGLKSCALLVTRSSRVPALPEGGTTHTISDAEIHVAKDECSKAAGTDLQKMQQCIKKKAWALHGELVENFPNFTATLAALGQIPDPSDRNALVHTYINRIFEKTPFMMKHKDKERRSQAIKSELEQIVLVEFDVKK